MDMEQRKKEHDACHMVAKSTPQNSVRPAVLPSLTGWYPKGAQCPGNPCKLTSRTKELWKLLSQVSMEEGSHVYAQRLMGSDRRRVPRKHYVKYSPFTNVSWTPLDAVLKCCASKRFWNFPNTDTNKSTHDHLAAPPSRKLLDLESEGIISDTSSFTNLRQTSSLSDLIFFFFFCKIKGVTKCVKKFWKLYVSLMHNHEWGILQWNTSKWNLAAYGR